jgi:hypothetical protein|tara:strand:+ start:1138 stop:1452 length:315 start_codon:yes stop_codon:yes gene_type:complete
MVDNPKNVMPYPRICALSGVEMTLYSEVVWLPVFDQEKGEWRDAPTHISKQAVWKASKTSPTHPNNRPEQDTPATDETTSEEVEDVVSVSSGIKPDEESDVAPL